MPEVVLIVAAGGDLSGLGAFGVPTCVALDRRLRLRWLAAAILSELSTALPWLLNDCRIFHSLAYFGRWLAAGFSVPC